MSHRITAQATQATQAAQAAQTAKPKTLTRAEMSDSLAKLAQQLKEAERKLYAPAPKSVASMPGNTGKTQGRLTGTSGNK